MKLGFSPRNTVNHVKSKSRRDPLRRQRLAFDHLEDRRLLATGSDLTITMYADSTGILAGQTAGFTVTISNDLPYAAQGVTLSDPLPQAGPAGLQTLNWQIDTSSGIHPEDFVISGDSLSLAPSVSSLAVGEVVSVHIIAQTTTSDSGTLLNIATVNASNEPLFDQNAQAAAEIALDGGEVLPFMEPLSTPYVVPAFGSDGTLSATATLVNYDYPPGSNFPESPPGDVYFWLFPPDVPASTLGTGAIYEEATPLNSDTAQTGTGSVVLGAAVPIRGVGQYTWEAIYGGYPNVYGEVASVAFAYVDVGPIFDMTPGGPVVFGSGKPLSDAVTQVTGSQSANDYVAFYLYEEGKPHIPLYTEVAPVVDGFARTGSGQATGSAVPSEPGVYYWAAVWDGNVHDESVNPNGVFEDAFVPIALSTSTGGTVTLGSGQALTHSPTLSGGYNPTGTITFNLYAPSDTTYSSPIYSTVVPVSGDGTYSVNSLGSTDPGGYLPTVTGSYQWVVSYSGDGGNQGATSGNGNGPEDVAPPLSLSASTGGTVTLGTGQALADSATLSGGYKPTGTITFLLFAPGGYVVYDDTEFVNGDGSYSTGRGGYIPSVAGTYQWVAIYSGDIVNPFVASTFGAEPEQVVEPLNYTSSGGDVSLTLSNGNLQIIANGNEVASAPLVDVSSVNITGADGVANNFTLDYSNGAFFVPGGITFNGGALPSTPSNALTIVGGNFDTDTYDFTNAHDGSIQLGTNGQVVHYSNLTPLLNTGTANNVVLDLPDGTVDATLDAGTNRGTIQLLSSNGAFEITTLAAPSGSLTVNAGNGVDTVIATDVFYKNFAGNIRGSATVAGPGASLIGDVLYLVGGNTNDQVHVKPFGTSNTGSTGVQVDAHLDGIDIDHQTFAGPISRIIVVGFGGNDNVNFDPHLTVATVVSEGDDNDNVQLGDGNNTVTAGNGNDHVQAGDGDNVVMLGNGNDDVHLGDGNNLVTLGNGNDSVHAGDGDNVIAAGSGNNDIHVGNGDNLVAGGTGHDNVHAGNGNNILIDGSVQAAQAGVSLDDALKAALDDWLVGGVGSESAIQDLLAVNFNTHIAKTLHAGKGSDWFWENYA